MTEPIIVAPADRYQASRWNTWGDHHRDNPDTGELFVRRFDGEIRAFCEEVVTSWQGGWAGLLHRGEATHCTLPAEQHGWVFRNWVQVSENEAIPAFLLPVCPGSWVINPVGNDAIEATLGFTGDLFDRAFTMVDKVLIDELNRNYREFAMIMFDLDRCQHGRHAIDPCYGCPGGKSTGNLLIPPNTLIGHTVHGRPIVVPAEGDVHHYQAWYREPGSPWTDVAAVTAHARSLAQLGELAIAVFKSPGDRQIEMMTFERAAADHLKQFPEPPAALGASA